MIDIKFTIKSSSETDVHRPWANERNIDMDKNGLLYYQSARALKLPASILEPITGMVIHLGKRTFYFRSCETPFNGGSSIGIADNKYCTNKILEASGFPVPKAVAFSKDVFEKEQTESLIANLNFPLVVKPMQGTSLGDDVLCNISSIDQLKLYMGKCYQKYNFLSIEEFYPNLNSYRVLVFYQKVIGVVQRFSARVVGDGTHTIKELVELQNIAREKLKNRVKLGPIKIDEETMIRLNELSLTVDSIPNHNETVVLCYTCNSTRGGTTKSLGKKINKDNARLLCQAASVLGLNFVGFDVVCEDILIPISKSRGVIIEANHNPAVSIHETPLSGPRSNVTKIVLRKLIRQHPISYLIALYRDPSMRLYVHLSLLVLVVIGCRLIG